VPHPQTLKSDPPLRRLVLADNGIGLEGAAALAEALRTNSTLQVGAGEGALVGAGAPGGRLPAPNRL
jgi:hypothetical protein